MRSHRGDGLLAFGLAIVLAAASGCAGAKGGNWLAFNKPQQSQRSNVITPGQRLNHLRELEERGPELTPVEQERISTNLAQAIPNEQDPLLRAQILRTIGALPTTTASRVLTAGMADSVTGVRVAACEAWGKRGGSEAAEQLAKALKNDAELDVRLAAARGLGTCGDPNQAVPALGQALEDPDPAMQRRAMLALAEVTGQDYGNDANAWREYLQGREPVREQSIASRLRDLF